MSGMALKVLTQKMFMKKDTMLQNLVRLPKIIILLVSSRNFIPQKKRVLHSGLRDSSHRKTGKPVYTEEQHILYAPVLQVIEHPQPELTGLISSYSDTQDILIAVCCYAHHNISGSILSVILLTISADSSIP